MSWKDTHRTRPMRKTVTFTLDEWTRAEDFYRRVRQARGGELSFSAHARRLLTEARVVTVTVALDPDKVRADMARIGNNVNQIARKANTYDHLSSDDVAKVLSSQEELRALFLRMCRERDEQLRAER